MARALIIGAGAIGRGYLPWELKNFEIDFYDQNIDLIESLISNNGYRSFMSFGDKLQELHISDASFFSNINNINLNSYQIAFICIGPRNLTHLDKRFGELNCPLFSLENDYKTVDFLKYHLAKEDISFGVPDVITSLTASPENLKIDCNALHTENGLLHLEKNFNVNHELMDLLPKINWVDREMMIKEWDAKLYIHNTPHCIAAFYGHLHGCNYVHEALAIDEVYMELSGVIDEVLQTLKIKTNHDHKFLEWYAEKEIARFSNKLLFDPIRRVGREPLRKLAPEGRLLGIMTMALEAGIFPLYLARGVAAALKFDLAEDPDSFIISNIDEMGVNSFLEYMISLDSNSIQAKLIKSAYENL